MKQVAKWAGNLFLAGLILVAIFVFLSPRLLHYRFLTVRSASMAPTIHVGSVVMVQPVKPEAVKVGDVITYRSADDPKVFVTHRVIDLVPAPDEISFVTQGDANEDPDIAPVAASRLVGRVVLAVPWVGYAGQYVRAPLGFGLFILVPAFILIVIQIKDLLVAVRSLRPGASR